MSGRRRQWPYALALLVLMPAALALPLRAGYDDARDRTSERETVAPASRPATWQGATWRFLSIREAGTAPGAELPTGGVHAVAALSVTPRDAATAERLASACAFELRDDGGRVWASSADFIPRQIDLPDDCVVEERLSSRPVAPGEEHVMVVPFVLTREALPRVDLRVVLNDRPSKPVLRLDR